jgi:2-polyprenyl-6-methoxyphenol hydroxylase-like FAD-dependent oxidoreductase
LLRELLAPYGGIAAQVREGITPGAAIVYRPLEVLLMPGAWHQGRVLLLGDAAHATTPHLASGAGLAVEDALVLGEELAAADSVPAALVAHTARRSARCRSVVEGSVAVGNAQLAGVPAPEVFALMRTVGGVLPQPY